MRRARRALCTWELSLHQFFSLVVPIPLMRGEWRRRKPEACLAALLLCCHLSCPVHGDQFFANVSVGNSTNGFKSCGEDCSDGFSLWGIPCQDSTATCHAT